ncbi:MAG: hypothetical protein RIB03_15810 [Henriciella sp.]|mgnify:CR=1 FL=1|uniref:hypothetical protein n=1 Tax=Henriciella sp. TaxID=1968823 RepID=UPI002611A441|nr:hypothetical protein [Henriciella sp.]
MSDVGMILQRVGATLVNDVAPKLEGDYAGGKAGMGGMLAVMAGEMWDKEADLLVGEITRLKALLSAAGIGEAEPRIESFKISDLKTMRNELASQLIELQASLEAKGDEASMALNRQIWGHLVATSAARMPSPPEFSGPDED